MSRMHVRFCTFLFLVCSALLPACGAKIGSACKTATQCSQSLDRVCDLSFASGENGECTIENCSANSCPKEAACVRTYDTQFLSTACDPDREDVVAGFNACTTYQVCLPDGYCADSTQLRTSCRLECGSDKDCRSAYTCRATGSNGVYIVQDTQKDKPTKETKICVPRL